MIFFSTLIFIWLIALGGIRSRILGGGILQMPEAVKRFLEAADCGLVLLALGFLDAGSALAYYPAAAVVTAITVFTCDFGHADGYQMGLGVNVTRNNTMTKPAMFLVRLLTGKPANRASILYDAIFMALTGLGATAPLGIGIMATTPHSLAGALVAASGVLNAPAYYLGRHFLEGKAGLVGTEWGEWQRGAFRAAARWGIIIYGVSNV